MIDGRGTTAHVHYSSFKGQEKSATVNNASLQTKFQVNALQWPVNLVTIKFSEDQIVLPRPPEDKQYTKELCLSHGTGSSSPKSKAQHKVVFICLNALGQT